MRNPRVTCALCGHRGSCANKLNVKGTWGDGWLCLRCARDVCATLDVADGLQPDIFTPRLMKCPTCQEREVLTLGCPKKCPVCSKAEPG
jgi:hypothetical protein